MNVNKKNFIFLSATTLIGFLLFFTLASTGSGGGGGGGKKDDGLSEPCNEPSRSMLIQLNKNFPSNSWRDVAYSSPNFMPVSPNLWTGAASAYDINDTPSQKYFCLVTVSATKCKFWKDDGVDETVWHVSNITPLPNSVYVDTPTNEQFKIKIEYYEQCGFYWNLSGGKRRGKWKYEATMSPQGALVVYNWTFVDAPICF